MSQPTICNQEGVKCNIEYCDGDLCNSADDEEGEEEGVLKWRAYRLILGKSRWSTKLEI